MKLRIARKVMSPPVLRYRGSTVARSYRRIMRHANLMLRYLKRHLDANLKTQ